MLKTIYHTARQLSGLNRLSALFTKGFPPFVLCYHQIESAEMQAHLAYLKKHFILKNINDLRLEDKGCCAITMDDCIREDFQKASRIAQQMEVPVTFYLPTGYAMQHSSMWPIKMKYLISQIDTLRLTNQEAVQTRHPAQKRAVFNHITAAWMQAGIQTTELEQQADDCCKAHEIDIQAIPDALRVISMEEVGQFNHDPFVSFGSHTANHPFFYLSTPEAIETEMTSSKQLLESVTGQEILSFCYPYGSNKIIGNIAPGIAGRIFQNATTLEPGIFNTGSYHQIPRIGIYPGDKTGHLATKIYHYQNRVSFGI